MLNPMAVDGKPRCDLGVDGRVVGGMLADAGRRYPDPCREFSGIARIITADLAYAGTHALFVIGDTGDHHAYHLDRTAL